MGILLMAVGSMRGLMWVPLWVPLRMHWSLSSKDQAERLRGKSAEVYMSRLIHCIMHKHCPYSQGGCIAADREMISSSV